MAARTTEKKKDAPATTDAPTTEWTDVPIPANATDTERSILAFYNAQKANVDGAALAAHIGSTEPNRGNNHLRAALEKAGVERVYPGGKKRTKAEKLDPVQRAVRDMKSRIEALENMDTDPPTLENVKERLERRVAAAKDALAAFTKDPDATMEAEVARWNAGAEQRAQDATTEKDALAAKLAALEAAGLA